jgi:predicted enzyme related to lactoylglutathione lyase
VDDAQTVAERAEALGGRVLMAATPVSNAGELAFVADPAGNAIGVMHYR